MTTKTKRPHRYKQSALMTELERAHLVEHIGRLQREVDRLTEQALALHRRILGSYVSRQ